MSESRIAYLLWNSATDYSRSSNAYQKIRLAIENLGALIVLPAGCRAWIPNDLMDHARILELAFPRILSHSNIGKIFGGVFCVYASIRLKRKCDLFLLNTGNECMFCWTRLIEYWARVVLFCWDPPGIAVRDGTTWFARFRCLLMDWLFSLVARRSVAVILNLHDGFLGRFHEDVRCKIRVFQNGTNIAANRAAASDVRHVPKRIAANGAFFAVKGCWDIANIFVDSWSRDPEVSLIWIGRGPEKAEIERFFVSKGIPASAYTLSAGSHDYAMKHLATASVAINAYRDVESLRWNYVLKAPEFLSLGLPIVSVRLPGAASYVEEGETGVFFKSGDLSGAVRAIGELFADRDRLGRMQERAADASLKFEWGAINCRIAQFVFDLEKCRG